MNVTVLLAVDDAHGLVETVRSLDLQTLPRTSYDVVLVVPDSDQALAQRITTLTRRRPNLAMRRSTDLTSACQTAVAEATGDHVLPISAGTVLHPEALQRLLAVAEHSGAAVVVGRRSGDSAARPDGEPTESFAGDAALVMARTEQAVASSANVAPGADGWLSGWRRAVLSAAPEVQALTSYPAVRGVLAESDPGVGLVNVTMEWAGATIRLSAQTSLEVTDATLFVHEVDSGLEYAVSAQVNASETGATLDADLAIGAVALGAPLPDGHWRVGFDLFQGDTHHRVLVPNGELIPALVHGRPVVRSLKRRYLHLQVGQIRRNIVEAEPSTARIVETVSGTRMELPLTNLHVADSEQVTGEVLLGGLPVRADIHTRDGAPVLEVLLSGLAGDYPLSSRFGNKTAAATGLRLRVDGAGAMKLDRQPAGPVAAKVADATPVGGTAQVVLQRLRAAVPDQVAKALGRRGGRG